MFKHQLEDLTSQNPTDCPHQARAHTAQASQLSFLVQSPAHRQDSAWSSTGPPTPSQGGADPGL